MSSGVLDFKNTLKHSVFMFLFTILFTKPTLVVKKKYNFLEMKCIAGGIILSEMIFHIFQEVHEVQGCLITPFITGLSFLLLFWIDKLCLSANEHGSLPKGAKIHKALFIILALSIHSFFEGLGVCIKNADTFNDYMVSLYAHKWIEAFVLGWNVEFSEFSLAAKNMLIVVYSALTPLGIITSFYLCRSSIKPPELNKFNIEKILSGLSAGSFIYIGFIEMIIAGFEDEHTLDTKKRVSQTVRLSCLTAGFCGMSLIIFARSALG